MTRTRPTLTCFVVVALSTSGIASPPLAQAEAICRPKLTLTNVAFSQMQPPTLERTWSALVTVNADGCLPDAHGEFEIVFTRLKEIGRAIEFRERFTWRTPSVPVEVAFWADEAVEVNGYWIDNVSTCPCQRAGSPTN